MSFLLLLIQSISIKLTLIKKHFLFIYLVLYWPIYYLTDLIYFYERKNR